MSRYARIAAVTILTSACVFSQAQQAKVGPKEPIAAPAKTANAELDHIAELITKLKADTDGIQDPSAKLAAADNLDLWQHLLDHIAAENTTANSVRKSHHHETDPASSETKASAKPK